VTAFWCEQAWLGDTVRPGVLVRCADGVITEVSVGASAPDGARRLPGLVLPGLANAHSHAFHRALRGRTHGGGTFWTWREAMYALAARLDPDSYRRLATAVYAEMVLAGWTCVGEFHYLHHAPGGRRYAEPNAMGEALIQAAGDAGIRLTLLDTLYLRGGLGPDGYLPLDGVQLRFCDGDIDGWSERMEQLRARRCVRIGAALHSVRAVPHDVLGTFAYRSDGLPVHVHLSEQPAENEACLAYHGYSPAGLLDLYGVLAPTVTAVHATHVTPGDVELLGSAGVSVCPCPTTEADLADGIGPMRALADAGCPVVLGSDQHAVVDPFAEARGLEAGERLSSLRRGRFTPAELLRALTVGGHAALGWPSGGRIAIGAPCDLVAVQLDSPRTAGCLPDQVVLAASASDVDSVVVGGRVVVESGSHRTLGDVGALLAAAIAEVWR
jgi:formiminoglutamate deiminase